MAVAVLLLGYAQPVHRAASRTVPVAHSATFAYSATVPPGTFYGSTTVLTGQPVFLALATKVDVLFTDVVPLGLQGTGSLEAAVSDSAGWQRVLPLADRVAVRGPQVELRGVLDLAAIRALTDQYATQSGTAAGTFTVTLRAAVDLAGQVQGVPVTSTFRPTLGLRLDRLALTAPVGSSPGPASAKPTPDPFQVTQTDSASGSVRAPAQVSLLGLAKISVAAIRTLGRILLVVGLLVLAGALLLRRQARGDDEVTAIRRRYSDLLVPALSQPMTPTTVHVAAIEDLVALARRYENAIVHVATGEAHTFSVYDGAVTYRYVLTVPSPAPAYTGPNGHRAVTTPSR